ncbi:sugar-specific transcriptional regulator, TrmB family [Leptospira broomii serovar Hurstbridge str. 5399]|uniref:Sugar-specific transcriptional regulator, TrmB family n=2 Tax=Leptospira broomii TaxID=301541 RepID=T0FEN3_9LEPT|nr:sugar-specific transcriptional regulator, TrmB family [Leptospira broomii serovar Hurstbridge str. 5399]
MNREMGKNEYIQAIGQAVQLFQEATEAFDDAAAEVLGLNRTDLKCLSIIFKNGSVSASEIARITGLTRGAMTTALDRIEKAGYAKRVPDPNDRRGVLLEPTKKGENNVGMIWGPFFEVGKRLLSKYTVDELKVIQQFLIESRAAQFEQMDQVKKLKLGKRT